MRTPLLLTSLLAVGAVHAQLINGSFEADGASDLTGWSSLCSAMSSSSDVPGGTGDWSLRIAQMDHWDCPQDYVYQYLPFVHCGDVWELGAWARTDASAQLGMSISFITRYAGVFGEYQGGMGTDQLDWSYMSSTFGVWCNEGDSVFLILDAGNMFPDSSYGNVWFDDISLSLVSTSVNSKDASALPAFRPNPATDRLWVDLQEPPLSITAIDASGRAHDLKNLIHRQRTLEVDVSTLPIGITLLRMVTNNGNRHIRFIKA